MSNLVFTLKLIHFYCNMGELVMVFQQFFVMSPLHIRKRNRVYASIFPMYVCAYLIPPDVVNLSTRYELRCTDRLRSSAFRDFPDTPLSICQIVLRRSRRLIERKKGYPESGRPSFYRFVIMRPDFLLEALSGLHLDRLQLRKTLQHKKQQATGAGNNDQEVRENPELAKKLGSTSFPEDI